MTVRGFSECLRHSMTGIQNLVVAIKLVGQWCPQHPIAPVDTFGGWLVCGEEAGSISLRGGMIREGKTLKLFSWGTAWSLDHKHCCWRARSQSQGRSGLGFPAGMQCASCHAWTEREENTDSSVGIWRTFLPFAQEASSLRQRGGVALRPSWPSSSCSSETLPSSGVWAGELNEEAPANLVWDLPETRINRGTLEILQSCGWQLWASKATC